jgi:hypothetical protein
LFKAEDYETIHGLINQITTAWRRLAATTFKPNKAGRAGCQGSNPSQAMPRQYLNYLHIKGRIQGLLEGFKGNKHSNRSNVAFKRTVGHLRDAASKSNRFASKKNHSNQFQPLQPSATHQPSLESKSGSK